MHGIMDGGRVGDACLQAGGNDVRVRSSFCFLWPSSNEAFRSWGGLSRGTREGRGGGTLKTCVIILIFFMHVRACVSPSVA